MLWALVKTVGLYPAGSVLLTDSGHVALSLSPNPEDPRHPHCRVLSYPGGRAAEGGEADSWSPMPSDINVVRVLRPEEHQFEAGEALAA